MLPPLTGGVNPFDPYLMASVPISTSNSEQNCGICWQKVGSNFSGVEGSKDPSITLHCNHTFCRECVDPWVSKQTEACCPTCKERFNFDDIDDLYPEGVVESSLEEEGILCAVCLRPVGHNPGHPGDSVVTLSCDPTHKFCKLCIGKYFKTAELIREECPHCQKYVEIEKLVEINGKKAYIVRAIKTAWAVLFLLSCISLVLIIAAPLSSRQYKQLRPVVWISLLILRFGDKARNFCIKQVYQCGEEPLNLSP